MKKHTQAQSNDVGTLLEDAKDLIAATVHVAGDKVREARERLATALESVKKIGDRVRLQTGEAAEATDEAVREHPYMAIGIAFGVGALLGILVGRRCAPKGEGSGH
jgi:ElaB/YqjD/DUF883 family membrane-anchored ribosome-binding protein